MSEQMNMHKVVEIIAEFKRHINTLCLNHERDDEFDKAIAFLENEMKYPTRIEIIDQLLELTTKDFKKLSLSEKCQYHYAEDTLKFINAPKE